METPVKFCKLHPDAIIPKRATKDSAGFDLYALEGVTIYGCEGNFLVKTGIAVELPEGTYGRIAMRSGLALTKHLTVSAGVIDRDYTGEIGVLVSATRYRDPRCLNAFSQYRYTINKGERFAQLVIEKIYSGDAIEVEEISNKEIEHTGFGSTGAN
jgi:dUTP pyrophosphatase